MSTHERALRLVGSYIELLTDFSPRITPGLIKLYTLRASGSILTAPTLSVDQMLQDLGSIRRDAELHVFHQSCVIENCVMFADMLVNMIGVQRRNSYLQQRGGERQVIKTIRDTAPRPYVHLPSACLDALVSVTKVLQGSGLAQTENSRHLDVLGAAALTFTHAGLELRENVNRPTRQAEDIVTAALTAFRSALTSPQAIRTRTPDDVYRRYHLPLLTILRAMLAMYADLSLDTLRTKAYTSPNGTTLSLPTGLDMRITDSTLAALPLPTLEMLHTCVDAGAGVISRKGLHYVHCAESFIGSPTV